MKYILPIWLTVILACIGHSAMTNNFNERETVIKISYLGPQDKPIASLLFLSAEIDASIDTFRKHKVLYDNDEFGMNKQKISDQQMMELVEISKKYAEQKSHIKTSLQMAVVVLNLRSNDLLSYNIEKPSAIMFMKEFKHVLPKNKDLSNWALRSRLLE